MSSISDEKKALAVLAHDIKGPLSSIIDLLNIIDKGYVTDPEKSKQLISRAIKKTSILIKMVDDILDFSKLEDKSLMKREKLNIFNTLNESIALMRQYAENRNIEIEQCEFCHNEEYVYGNHTFLMRVFNNIIMNAIKYNKKNGKIVFNSFRDKENRNIIMEISDTGIGISEEDIENVFLIFERGSNARRNIDGSIGLGLSLVKQIVEDHEGTIEITSTLNVGTTLKITLPLYTEGENNEL
ncbi:MAG: HAMP domain-containing sensor histidine kinase [Acidobacteriota bacterium]